MFLKLGQVLVNGSSRLPNTHCKWKVRNDLVVQAPDWVQQPACASSGDEQPGCKNRDEEYYRE